MAHSPKDYKDDLGRGEHHQDEGSVKNVLSPSVQDSRITTTTPAPPGSGSKNGTAEDGYNHHDQNSHSGRKRTRKPTGRPRDEETRREFIISASSDKNMKSERARCRHCDWEKAYNLPRLRMHLVSCSAFLQDAGASRVADLCARWQLTNSANALDVSPLSPPPPIPPPPRKKVRLQPDDGASAAPDPVVKATLNALRKARVVTVIRAVDSDAALERACDLVKNCGCRAIEITRDSHAWLDVLRGIVEKVGDQAVVGVGTILSAEDVHAAAANGAKFALSPVNPPGFVSACLDSNVLAVPGCFTPQEVFNAIADGASLIKIFPAQNFGVASLRALRSISHFRAVCFLATGGIDEAGAHEWFDAGCAVVGMGALICGRDLGTQDPGRAAELRQAYLADGGGRSIARGILERLKLTDA